MNNRELSPRQEGGQAENASWRRKILELVLGINKNPPAVTAGEKAFLAEGMLGQGLHRLHINVLIHSFRSKNSDTPESPQLNPSPAPKSLPVWRMNHRQGSAWHA